jgi:hypothetical protein
MSYILFIKTERFEDTMLFHGIEFATKEEAIARREKLFKEKTFMDSPVIYTSIKEGRI